MCVIVEDNVLRFAFQHITPPPYPLRSLVITITILPVARNPPSPPQPVFKPLTFHLLHTLPSSLTTLASLACSADIQSGVGDGTEQETLTVLTLIPFGRRCPKRLIQKIQSR
jgi:hypothetical protein